MIQGLIAAQEEIDVKAAKEERDMKAAKEERDKQAARDRLSHKKSDLP